MAFNPARTSRHFLSASPSALVVEFLAFIVVWLVSVPTPTQLHQLWEWCKVEKAWGGSFLRSSEHNLPEFERAEDGKSGHGHQRNEVNEMVVVHVIFLNVSAQTKSFFSHAPGP